MPHSLAASIRAVTNAQEIGAVAEAPSPEIRNPQIRVRNPGVTGRKARIARALEQLRTEIRAEKGTDEGVDLDEDEVERQAQARLAELRSANPHALRWYLKTAPSSRAPDRRGLVENVEIAAMRRLGPARELDDGLRYGSRGRPTDRRLPMAIFERNIYANGRPEIRCYRERFLGADHQLDWAHDQPVRQGGGGTSESAVYETLGRMLDRNDPELAIGLNLHAVRELAQGDTDRDIGLYCAIDGTSIEAHRDQHQSVSPVEEGLITRGMDGAAFGYHQADQGREKAWRGYTALILSDLKSGLPLAWKLIPANRPEFEHVLDVLDLLLKYWPDCPIEFLTSDREFTRSKQLSGDLEFRYGIHPVFPLRAGAEGRWATSLGVPKCAAHGVMKRRWGQDFFLAKHRIRSGVRRGDLSDAAQTSAHLRFRCIDPQCLVGEVTTYVRDDPRLYTYLPRTGKSDHLVGKRAALLARHNIAESVNARLKGRGVGLGGQRHPKWVSTDRQMEWLVGGTLLGMSLQRLAHESGGYARELQEALDRGLIKAPLLTAQAEGVAIG